MNSPLDSLRSVIGGRSGSTHHLLNTCRFEGFGGEVLGSNSVADEFRLRPFVVAPQPHVVAQPHTIAILDSDTHGEPVCFFAETYKNQIGRLWRVGPAPTRPLTSVPAVSVPFDPRMSQIAPRVAFNATDHPELAAAAATHIENVVDELCELPDETGSGKSPRRTPFVIRAVSQDQMCALLLQMHELTTDPVRRSYFRLAAVFFRFAGTQLIHSVNCLDATAGSDWTPRIWSPPAATDEAAS